MSEIHIPDKRYTIGNWKDVARQKGFTLFRQAVESHGTDNATPEFIFFQPAKEPQTSRNENNWLEGLVLRGGIDKNTKLMFHFPTSKILYQSNLSNIQDFETNESYTIEKEHTKEKLYKQIDIEKKTKSAGLRPVTFLSVDNRQLNLQLDKEDALYYALEYLLGSRGRRIDCKFKDIAKPEISRNEGNILIPFDDSTRKAVYKLTDSLKDNNRTYVKLEQNSR